MSYQKERSCKIEVKGAWSIENCHLSVKVLDLGLNRSSQSLCCRCGQSANLCKGLWRGAHHAVPRPAAPSLKEPEGTTNEIDFPLNVALLGNEREIERRVT